VKPLFHGKLKYKFLVLETSKVQLEVITNILIKLLLEKMKMEKMLFQEARALYLDQEQIRWTGVTGNA
jgi:hypothetical protein